MHDETRSAAEDGVELVFAGDRKTSVAASLEARESVAKVPAPRPLAYISRQGSGVADLRRRHTSRSFGQYSVIAQNQRMMAQSIQRDQAADIDGYVRYGHLIQTLDRSQMNQNIGRDDPVLDHTQQIAAAAGDYCLAAIGSRLLGERHRLPEIARISIDQGFHANAPTSLSRRIGSSFMRCPVALKIALPTAATAGIFPA